MDCNPQKKGICIKVFTRTPKKPNSAIRKVVRLRLTNNKRITMSVRKWSITRKEGEWYNAKVTDSFGESHQNWFEQANEANDWIYYMWETEKPPLDKEERDELLANAIHDCRQIDQRAGLRAIL